MSEKTVPEKLGHKPGMLALLLNAPADHAGLFAELDHTSASLERGVPTGTFDLVLAFAQDSEALATVSPAVLAAIKPDARVWIAYPKRTSKLATDLHRDHGWDPLEDAGWIVIAIVSLDADWSAVRFRPRALVKSLRQGASA